MNLIRWQPFTEADDFFRGFPSPILGRLPRLFDDEGSARLEWSPAADISETEKEYLVKAELLGVKREDIKVDLADGVLTIAGERRLETDEKSEKSHRVERFYGSFRRSFGLPQNADAAGIRAESKDGVLNVHVPKLKVDKPKATQIKVD
jgi:HSP20 family protein